MWVMDQNPLVRFHTKSDQQTSADCQAGKLWSTPEAFNNIMIIV
jgi:hypothetical protein